jgi:GNAT superfamily N-acetyltransferase
VIPLRPTDSPAPGTFATLFGLLDASSRPLIGPANPRVLAIPLHDEAGAVSGGLWGTTLFGWLQIQMLFVPPGSRCRGVGARLVGLAEEEARIRDCRGAYVDTFSFQAGPFYQRLGYLSCGALEDCPPGHRRMWFAKRLDKQESDNG